MRNYLKKLNLWQQKRNSLPILDDAQLDWAEMEAILNREMPQNEDDKHIIILSPPKKLNLLSLMLFSFSAAAMTLVVRHVIKTNHYQQIENHQIHHKKHHRLFNNSDLNSLNDSLTYYNDTLMFDSVALKSYLFINSTAVKGEVKIESIADAVALNSTPIPLVSYWQQSIFIDTPNNLKALTVVEQKKTAIMAKSNKGVYNDAPLPLFSNNWLNFGVKKLPYKADKQLNKFDNIAIDSIANEKSNLVKEHAVAASAHTEIASTTKTISNSIKNNSSLTKMPINTLHLANTGAYATADKSNLIKNAGRANKQTEESMATMNKVAKLKNEPHKANTLVDTIITPLVNKNGNNHMVNSEHAAGINNKLIKNSNKNSTKNLHKNSVLVNSANISNNVANIKATKTDSVALIAKSENKYDDSVIANASAKNSNAFTKNNKNQLTKKSKPTTLTSIAPNNSNSISVKKSRSKGTKTINETAEDNSTLESPTADSVINPIKKAYPLFQNKNSQPNYASKTKKNSSKAKNKISKAANNVEEDNSFLAADEPIVVSSVTKKVSNEVLEPELMTYGNPTIFYINEFKLKPIGKPIYQNILNENSNNEDVLEEDVELESKTAKTLTLLDYGLLFGFNNPDSFYSYNQGANSNGSLPVSPFFGFFANLNIHKRWSVSSQIRFMVPRNNAIDYNFSNQIGIDSIQQLKINNTRKIYTLDIPLHLIYRVNKNISLYGGPTFSIPLMQINVNNRLQTDTISAGIATYSPYSNIADNSFFSRKLSFGISAGANYQFDRYYLGFMWDKSLTGYQINSSYGNSNSFLSSFQLTFGISLKKPKNK